MNSVSDKAVNDRSQSVDSQEADRSPSLRGLLRAVLGRTPKPAELDAWAARMRKADTPQRFVEQLMKSRAVRSTKQVPVHNPAGHFFSPVVDPEQVTDYVEENREAGLRCGIAGVELPLAEMEDFWIRNRQFIASTPFHEKPTPEFRYCFTGGPYNYGDGTTLRAVIADRRPKKIIEIGSGYSTACMLDTVDELGFSEFQLTCIEPYPERLYSILRDHDKSRVTVIEQGVQGQFLEQFSALEPNDILFIDSTHVLKTGSDVHYELFYILPVLKPGVVIHFHDCRFPFEYSDKQIFEKNYSWNEVYGVRALLMYSSRFKVIFSGSYFAAERGALVRDTFPTFMRNPGSALWLEVLDNGKPFGLAAVGDVRGFESRSLPDKPSRQSRPTNPPATAGGASGLRKDE